MNKNKETEEGPQPPIPPPGGIAIQWISEEEHRCRAAERKAALGLLNWNELKHAAYPTFFTATFEYSATGEGVTIGVSMHHANSYQHLRECIERDFGPHFGPWVEVALGLVILPIIQGMLPSSVVKMIKVLNGEVPGERFIFSYSAQLYQNYA